VDLASGACGPAWSPCLRLRAACRIRPGN
jgi:hypothetical protein